ncbi:hypothetical protein AB0I53_19630 [Saccharopolyspora sp. NPDC050389]|uniref:hypothetical protein n=1 Tax=Saccharopolyspora sp. NPDC050389 TaxID=3155516 RepID=UPI00340FCA81
MTGSSMPLTAGHQPGALVLCDRVELVTDQLTLLSERIMRRRRVHAPPRSSSSDCPRHDAAGTLPPVLIRLGAGGRGGVRRELDGELIVSGRTSVHITAHTQPSGNKPNEDWFVAADGLVVVLDGATIRTDTGCVHGLPWYVRTFGASLVANAADHARDLRDVLAGAIRQVAAAHTDTCDLEHRGTPSAAVGLVRWTSELLEWIVLGDITVIVETTSDGVVATCDDRVSHTGSDERRECDKFLIGTDEKMAAILAMKEVELASRNQEGGYWIASNDPDAATHSLAGARFRSTRSCVSRCAATTACVHSTSPRSKQPPTFCGRCRRPGPMGWSSKSGPPRTETPSGPGCRGTKLATTPPRYWSKRAAATKIPNDHTNRRAEIRPRSYVPSSFVACDEPN